MTSQVEGAHSYGRRGWRVVPLHHITPAGFCSCRLGRMCPPKSAGKHPVHNDWPDIGSASGADIEAWWESDPEAGIGIVTGAVSGFWVLDLDGADGLNTITALATEHGPLPQTRCILTGSGGFHFYFLCPADFVIHNSAGWIGPGVDVRGERGQVVAPPSTSARGPYGVVRDADPLLAAPDWLLDMLREHSLSYTAGRTVTVALAEAVDVSFLPANVRTLASTLVEPDQGRFRAFHALVAACREAGYTQGQAVTIAAPWCAAVGKFANRVAAEVARCWGKLDAADERGEAWLPGSTARLAPRSPPPDPPAEGQALAEPVAASWSRIALGAILDGTHAVETPTAFPRTDGAALLYPGRVHSFHGESESGKSLIAQAEAARVLAAGGRVLYLDWESDETAVVDRLRLMGAPAHAIAERFDYRRPETSPFALADEREAWAAMLADTYALAVLDGVTEALVTSGGATKDNDEITKWVRAVPRRIAQRTGAAVVLIDHVTKDAESRGRFAIGGQAKMAALDGAAYVIEVAEALGRGLRGLVIMRVAKDRPGGVRPVCGPFRKSDRTQEAARVVVDSTVVDHVEITVSPPLGKVADADTPAAFRPTVLMERVSRFLEARTEAASMSAVQEGVTGRESVVKVAVEILATEGYVTASAGPRKGTYYGSARPYRQDDDALSETFVGWAEGPPPPPPPTPAQPPPGGGQDDPRPPPPTPKGGRGSAAVVETVENPPPPPDAS